MVRRQQDDAEVTACVAALEHALHGNRGPLGELTRFPPDILTTATKRLARQRGGEALPIIEALLESRVANLMAAAIEALADIPDERSAELLASFVAEGKPSGALRSAARRSRYRLSRAGIKPPSSSAASRPLVAQAAERPMRAWSTGISGAGSRALWILFESSAGLSLLTVVINDQWGVIQCAGGPISKRQLSEELKALETGSKLPWLEIPPDAAASAVAEALAIHKSRETEPPESFFRWRKFFSHPPSASSTNDADEASSTDPTLLDHSAELLNHPETADWYLDPETVQSEGVELLEARESRLVINDQIKAEREAAIVDRAIDRVFTNELRSLWAKRLRVTAWVLKETGRSRDAAVASATASALSDPEKASRHIPFVRALTQRGLDLATEVALGQVKREEVSPSLRPLTPPSPPVGERTKRREDA